MSLLLIAAVIAAVAGLSMVVVGRQQGKGGMVTSGFTMFVVGAAGVLLFIVLPIGLT